MFRFRVGALDCVSLNDGDLALPPEALFPASRRDDWPSLPVDARGELHLAINCLLVRAGGQTVLVDTGNGTKPSNMRAGGGLLLSELAAAGVQPSEVDLVVVTHAHGDHVGGATTLVEGHLVPTFPRARHVMPRADWDYYLVPERARQMTFVPDSMLPLAEAGLVELVEGEVEITPYLRMLPTPGHTPGHSVVALTSQGETMLHLGDLVHHHLQFDRRDLIRGFDDVPPAVPLSRLRIVDLALQHSALLFAVHEAPPGLGRLRREGERVVYLPVG